MLAALWIILGVIALLTVRSNPTYFLLWVLTTILFALAYVIIWQITGTSIDIMSEAQKQAFENSVNANVCKDLLCTLMGNK